MDTSPWLVSKMASDCDRNNPHRTPPQDKECGTAVGCRKDLYQETYKVRTTAAVRCPDQDRI